VGKVAGQMGIAPWGLDRSQDATAGFDKAAGYGVLFQCRPLLIFCVCVLLFHFANAPPLPRVGQKLTHPKWADVMMGVLAERAFRRHIYAAHRGTQARSLCRKPL
jgi:hypothetical protein